MSSGATTIAARGANVAANGVRLHYLRYGEGKPPLVLAPGITSPAITWGFVAQRLAQTYDVYALDVRGRGLSSSGPNLDYGLDALAADLVAFIAALSLREPVVLGHSMGARIAIRAAAQTPEAAARLILVDPPVSGPGRRPYPAQWSWYADSIRWATRGMTAGDMRAFFPTWTHEQRALRAEWLATCYEPAIVAAFAGFHEDDIHKDLPLIRCPLGLMVAGRGGVIEPADEAEMRHLAPTMAIARVADAGHMVPWDDFDGFFRALDQLVASTPDRRAPSFRQEAPSPRAIGQ